MCEIRICEEQLEELACRIAAKLSPPTQRPLTVSEAMAELRLSRSTLESRVHAGVIQRVPGLGRKILIPRCEINRLLAGEQKGGVK